MAVYSVNGSSNITVTDNYGNPTVSIVATPIFNGVNVGGALTNATTGSFSGAVSTGTITVTGQVGIGGTPVWDLDVQSAANQGVRITSATSAILNMWSQNAGTAIRNYTLVTNFSVQGDIALRQSSALGGNPISAGVNRLYFDAAGNTTLSAALAINGALTGATSGAFSANVTALTNNSAAYFGVSGTTIGHGDDGASVRGWNAWCASSATYGWRFWNGFPGTGTVIAQLTSGGVFAATSFAAGSSSYGSASAVINGSLSATTGVFSGASVQVGATGSTTADNGFFIGNNQGGSNYAFMVTHDATSVAGITGSVFSFGQGGVLNAVNVDLSGNMGIAGSFYAVSASDHKRGIRAVSFDAVQAIKNTTVAHFNYKHDPEDHEERLGLIADTSPTEISPTQDRHDFMRVSTVTIAALQAVIARLEALEASRA